MIQASQKREEVLFLQEKLMTVPNPDVTIVVLKGILQEIAKNDNPDTKDEVAVDQEAAPEADVISEREDQDQDQGIKTDNLEKDLETDQEGKGIF